MTSFVHTHLSTCVSSSFIAPMPLTYSQKLMAPAQSQGKAKLAA